MDEPKDDGPGTLPKVLLALVGIGAAAWFFGSGAYRELDAHRIRGEILALHGFGPIVFVLAFALLQPLGPSGHIFTIAATLVWTPPVAFALGLVGAVAAQATSFLFYRHVAGDFARKRLPQRLLAYEQRLVDAPFRTVVVMRIFLFTWPLVSMFLGVSRVRFGPMIAGTAVGLVPGVALDVWLGGAALNWLAS